MEEAIEFLNFLVVALLVHKSKNYHLLEKHLMGCP